MQTAPLPADESERLRALVEYEILDSEAEGAFDDLTELLANILGTPIALISLVDSHRQWFKSRHGLEATETPRDIAFCAHAILGKDLFEVPDARADQRFADNPLVTGEPRVRFYAGMPLVTPSGHRIGTLCAIDHEPRVLSPEQARSLEIVAAQVVGQLELRKSLLKERRSAASRDLLVSNLKLANKDLQDVMYVISHDMRAPIVNVVGFSTELLAATESVRALLEREEISPGLRRAIATLVEQDIEPSIAFMRKSIDQLDERLTAVLTLSRLNRRPLTPQMLDAQELAEQVAAMHAAELEAVGGIITVERLPRMCVDRAALETILQCLLSNAVKFRSPERPLEVRVTATSDDTGVIIAVADNGRGIREADLEPIFGMFRRFGPADVPGVGMGLAYAKALTQRLGGRLWCESSLGKGSAFRLHVPDGFLVADVARAPSSSGAGAVPVG